MFLYLNKAFVLAFQLIFILFFTISCMHVKNLDSPEAISTGISLNLNRLNNTGGIGGESFRDVIESDGYYITIGSSMSDLSGLTGGSVSQGSSDFVIAKFNKSDLSLASLNNLGGTGSDSFSSVIDSDGYYIAVGFSYSDLSGLTGGNVSQGSSDFVIAKFNKSDLSLVSMNNPGGTSGDYFSWLIDSDAYYIAVGYSMSNLSGLTGGSGNQGSNDFVIAKFNKSDLSLVSINNLGLNDGDYFSSLIESDGYYTAVGYSDSDLSGLTGGSTNQGGNDFVIAKFNKSDLSLASLNNLGGTGSDGFSSVIESDGYYIAVGFSGSDLSSFSGGSTSQGADDFVIAKFN